MQDNMVSHFRNLLFFITHTYFGIIRKFYDITGYFCLVSGLETFLG